MPVSDKQLRAETIVSAFLDLAAEHGSVWPHHTSPGTLVRMEHWELKILPGHRWSMARSYQERTARRRIEHRGWQTITLCWRGIEMFVANLHGEDRVDVNYFRPGQWEKRFGSDPGNDTVTHLPWDDPVGPHAEDQFRMREEDLKLHSDRDGPPSGDDLRSPSMRQHRSQRAIGRVDGPYTVALSQQTVPGF